MNKDNFLKHVRNMCDLHNIEYRFEGKTLSDCKALSVGFVTVKFSDYVYVDTPTRCVQFMHDELDGAYSVLLNMLFGTRITLNQNAFTVSTSVGPFYTFICSELDGEIVADIRNFFPGKIEALRFLTQFIPRPDFNGPLSNDIQLDGLPYTFKFLIG